MIKVKYKKMDILILVIPVIIMVLLTPILPDKVPIHWGWNNVADGFIDKKFSFILGVTPFVIYKLFKLKYGTK